MKIALIAHDKKKDDIIKLAIKYKDVLKEHRLFATGTTGSLIMAETGLDCGRRTRLGYFSARPADKPAARAGRIRSHASLRREKHPACDKQNKRGDYVKGAVRRRYSRSGKGQLKNTAPKKNCVFIFAFFPSDGTHPSIDDASVIHPKHTLYVRLFYFQQIDSRTKIHYSTVAPIYFLIV